MQTAATPTPTPNPAVIAWARKESGFEVPQVAKRLTVREDQVLGWETGERKPTVRQLMNLARYYQRPLSIFYQSSPPQLLPLAAEYRRLPNIAPGEESPELRFAVRDMLARRETTLDLYDELGYDLPQFHLSAHLTEDPRAVGERIRRAAGIASTQTLEWKDAWQAWRDWRYALEEIGALVFMFPNVKLSEVRGIALLRKPLPVVGVNTKESGESRAFTALHELVHLMLANGHEESPALEERRTSEEWLAVERFAETAASYALIDEGVLGALLGGGVPQDVDSMRRLAGRFKVTPLAMATRLRQSGFISWDQYGVWRDAWDQYVLTLPPKKSGFATPVSKTLGRGGRGYAQLVLEAIDANRITMADAARYLNLRTEWFDELRSRVVAGGAAEAEDE